MAASFCVPGPNAPCVLVSHGLESSKDSEKWLVLASRLCDAGIASLRFSYRGCGEGEGESEGRFEDTTLSSRVADFRAALDYVRGREEVDRSRLGVIGSSFGGLVAVTAGCADIKALVLLATPLTIPIPGKEAIAALRKKGYMELSEGRRLLIGFYDDLLLYDPPEAAKNINCPILIIHGSEDDIVPVGDAHLIYTRAKGPKRLEIVPGGDHTFSAPEHLGRIADLGMEWFERYLK